MNRFLAAASLSAALALGGCSTPSTPGDLNAFATEEAAITVAYHGAALWAQSGKETPAEAQVVESFRKSIDANVAEARKARDAGNNTMVASALKLAQQGVDALTAYMVQNGAPKP